MPRAQVAEISAERVAELKAKPVLSYQEAFELMRLTENAGYRLVKAGKFPCRVIDAGPRLHRVPTAALLRALGEEA
jgi:hypothetical protein